MMLDTVTKGRNNNLDMLRFIAAVMVVLCHAFPLALGEGVLDPLAHLTDDQISFGSLAVGIFFVYGAFLIAKSMCRIEKTGAYFKARIARIIPPLMVVSLILAFVAGPLLTTLSLKDYFTSSGTYKYLLNGLMVLQHPLPGVFEHNIYGSTVNGALWTLPVEFLCYCLCWFLYKCRLMGKRSMLISTVLFSAGCIVAALLSAKIGILASMIRPMGLFFAGMLYYVYQDRIRMNGYAALLSLVGMIVSAAAGVLSYTIFVFFPYFFFYIGFACPVKCAGFAKHGEVSYGMYLCAWPIQQMLAMFLANSDGKMSPWLNFVLTVPLSVLCGFLIYKGVEQPVARLLKKASKPQPVKEV